MSKREAKVDDDHGYILCPYVIDRESASHRSYSDNEIRCEGIVPDTILKTRFRRKSDRIFHEEVFCKKHYKDCEIAQAILRYKYGEDDKS